MSLVLHLPVYSTYIFLKESTTSLETRFLLADNLYCKASVPPTDKVCLWLGVSKWNSHSFLGCHFVNQCTIVLFEPCKILTSLWLWKELRGGVQVVHIRNLLKLGVWWRLLQKHTHVSLSQIKTEQGPTFSPANVLPLKCNRRKSNRSKIEDTAKPHINISSQ